MTYFIRVDKNPPGSHGNYDGPVEAIVRSALIHLNLEDGGQTKRAIDAIYYFRTIPLPVHSEGLIRAETVGGCYDYQ